MDLGLNLTDLDAFQTQETKDKEAKTKAASSESGYEPKRCEPKASLL